MDDGSPWGPAPDAVEVSRFYEDRLTSYPLIRVRPGRSKAAMDPGWSSLNRAGDAEEWRARLEGWHGPLGLVTGDGHVVVDVDSYKPEANDAFDKFVAEYGVDLTTTTVSTLRNGLHLHFLHDPAVELRSGPVPGFTGLDVKAAGGYVVVPPTIGYDFLAPALDVVAFEVEPLSLSPSVVALLERGARTVHEPVDGDSETVAANQRTAKLLVQRFGATVVSVDVDGTYLVRRPGKDEGSSGSVGKVAPGRFHNFSTSWTPFAVERAYTYHDLLDLLGERPKVSTDGVRPQESPYALLRVVDSRRQGWLWDHVIPVGQFVLGAGREKLGKSSALVWVGARVTRGELQGDRFGVPGNVAFLSAEDAADTVLKPRAVAAGADPDRFFVLDPLGEGFSVETVLDLDPALVVLDPLSLFLDGLGRGDEPGEVALRRSFAPLHDLAVTHDVTVVGVRHTRKAAGSSNPFDVVLGSRAWSAAARAVLFFVPDQARFDGRGGLLFARGNLAEGVAYRWHLVPKAVALDDGNVGEVPYFVLDGLADDVDLEEVLADAEASGAGEAARSFLLFSLAEGPQKAKNVIAAAAAQDIAERTLRRARSSLGVIVEREGSGLDHVVWWRLPTPAK
jgi:hypothetical protein